MGEYYSDPHRYDDMIDLPHHQSKVRWHMSLLDRAAQFAPFAALSGHEEAIEETTRVTDRRIELDENELSILDGKMQWIEEHLADQPEINVTYFLSDKKKTGGSYQSYTGNVKKIDGDKQQIIFTDKNAINIGQILDIQIEKIDV